MAVVAELHVADLGVVQALDAAEVEEDLVAAPVPEDLLAAGVDSSPTSQGPPDVFNQVVDKPGEAE